MIGFNAAKSHRIVDMREGHILRPELFALVEPLRELAGRRCCSRKRTAEVQLTLVDQGVDLSLTRASQPTGFEAIEALTAFATAHGLRG